MLSRTIPGLAGQTAPFHTKPRRTMPRLTIPCPRQNLDHSNPRRRNAHAALRKFIRLPLLRQHPISDSGSTAGWTAFRFGAADKKIPSVSYLLGGISGVRIIRDNAITRLTMPSIFSELRALSGLTLPFESIVAAALDAHQRNTGLPPCRIVWLRTTAISKMFARWTHGHHALADRDHSNRPSVSNCVVNCHALYGSPAKISLMENSSASSLMRSRTTS